ncbi:anthranilate phosphoribosyltransferase [Buchnera aphidicola (Mindarus keteleerifoliae)]|uniref:anthranilate phosphoribosyltransferase n=1 Tax=Buchnera aphidicola TaxID=9 RepID=UPI0031B68E6B
MKKILKKIYEKKNLTEIESYILFKNIIKGKLTSIQLSAVLISMKIRGETDLEILGAVQACLKYSKPFPAPSHIFADIVGTGGDKLNKINISTISAFVAAYCGFKIIKHCNYSISSQSGSADFLKSYGINPKVSVEHSLKSLKKNNICFLLASEYHSGFRFSTSVRKELKTSTIFNIIGPLLNPARPALAVIGVYTKKLLVPISKILKKLKYQHVILVNSNQCDEVTLCNETKIVELYKNKIKSYTLCPEDFGMNSYSKQALIGGTVKENYEIMKSILKGEGDSVYTETISANVGLLLKLFGHKNLKENSNLAFKSIKSGKVYNFIKNFSKKENYD